MDKVGIVLLAIMGVGSVGELAIVQPVPGAGEDAGEKDDEPALEWRLIASAGGVKPSCQIISLL
jgi:hypothetical protein